MEPNLVYGQMNSAFRNGLFEILGIKRGVNSNLTTKTKTYAH